MSTKPDTKKTGTSVARMERSALRERPRRHPCDTGTWIPLGSIQATGLASQPPSDGGPPDPEFLDPRPAVAHLFCGQFVGWAERSDAHRTTQALSSMGPAATRRWSQGYWGTGYWCTTPVIPPPPPPPQSGPQPPSDGLMTIIDTVPTLSHETNGTGSILDHGPSGVPLRCHTITALGHIPDRTIAHLGHRGRPTVRLIDTVIPLGQIPHRTRTRFRHGIGHGRPAARDRQQGDEIWDELFLQCLLHSL